MTMSGTHGRTLPEIEKAIRESIQAAVAADADGMDRAIEPILAEDACIWDAFTWTMGVIGVSLTGTPTGPGYHAVPLITVHDTETGETRECHVDDAPDDAPPGLVALMRLVAFYANGDREAAADLWEKLIQQEDEIGRAGEALGLPVEDQAPSILADIMTLALSHAAQTVKRIHAAQLRRFMSPN